MNKKSILDIDLHGKKVFCRVDFNVPIQDGKITDDNRLVAALPTIKYVVEHGGKAILASHLGRPKGEVVEELRLDIVAKELSKLLGKEVTKMDEAIGDNIKRRIDEMDNGDILLLENVRFYPGEEQNDDELAKEFASLADIYVNDAFGTAHRAHASTVGIAKYLPAVAGFLMLKEIEVLGKILSNPERPFTAIIGGAKVKDKIEVIDNLLDKVDNLIIGGGFSYTFVKALGYEIGESLLEEDKIELAKSLINKAQGMGVHFLMPIDFIVANEYSSDAKTKVVDINQIPANWQALDIGPKTIDLYEKIISDSKLVFWNGPMGVFEFDKFANGTNGVAKAMANSDAITIIGGGDSVAAIKKIGLTDKMTHISTGGGASLKFIEGKPLPGVNALNDKDR